MPLTCELSQCVLWYNCIWEPYKLIAEATYNTLPYLEGDIHTTVGPAILSRLS